MSDLYDRKRELSEAIAAGERARTSLQTASQRLDSASVWGMFDIFGGGLLSALIKHARIDDASTYVNQAKRDLSDFQKELGDIRDIEGLNVDVDGFLTFADFFLDGLLADLLVQSRIKDLKRGIETAITRIDAVLIRLRSLV